MDVSSLASISDYDVKNAMKHLWPLKSIGLYGIRNFVKKGSSKIIVPVLKFNFKLGLS
jgi:hypothetical protein